MPRVHHLRGPRALLFLACFTVTVLAATLTPEQLRSKTALLPARSFTHTLHSRTPPEQLRSKTVLFLARSFTRTLPSRTPPEQLRSKTVSLRARSFTRTLPSRTPPTTRSRTNDPTPTQPITLTQTPTITHPQSVTWSQGPTITLTSITMSLPITPSETPSESISPTQTRMCPATEPKNSYAPSACGGYATCEGRLCSCLKVPSTVGGQRRNATTCAGLSNLPCGDVAVCLKSFVDCLDTLTAARFDRTDSCATWASRLYDDTTASVGQAAQYAGSKLQSYCYQRSCGLASQMLYLPQCAFGTNYSTVCSAPPVRNAAVMGSIRLNISNAIAAMLGNATNASVLRAAVRRDLGSLLRISDDYLYVTDVRGNPLIVDFVVVDGSGTAAGDITGRLSTAPRSGVWLVSTSALDTANPDAFGLPVLSVGWSLASPDAKVTEEPALPPSTTARPPGWATPAPVATGIPKKGIMTSSISSAQPLPTFIAALSATLFVMVVAPLLSGL
jgi:hypothetical protein